MRVVSTPVGGAPAAAGRQGQSWLELLFLAGLAAVFLANAVTAISEPGPFVDLVDRSAAGRWFGLEGSWLKDVIVVNDLVLGVVLVAGIWITRLRGPVLAWAGAWLLVVAATRVTALASFPW